MLCQVRQWPRDPAHVGGRCEEEGGQELVLLLRLLAHARQELGAAHAVTHVKDLRLTRLADDVVQAGGEVVLTGHIPVPGPELLFVHVGVEGGVVAGVGVAAGVPQPDVVAGIKQNVGQGLQENYGNKGDNLRLAFFCLQGTQTSPRYSGV